MMKSSTRRCSLGSIQSSGRKASAASPRGTCAAIWQARSDTSKFSTLAAPDSPARSRRHVCSTPQANGLTMPSPVTTTRLMRSILSDSSNFFQPPFSSEADAPMRQGPDGTPAPSVLSETCTGGRRRLPSAGIRLFVSRRLLEKLDCVADSDDRFGLIVGNLDAKLFFEGHDQFDGVERISAQIVDEIGAFDDLVGVHAEVLHDDLLYALCDIAHFLNFPYASGPGARVVAIPRSTPARDADRSTRRPAFSRGRLEFLSGYGDADARKSSPERALRPATTGVDSISFP